MFSLLLGGPTFVDLEGKNNAGITRNDAKKWLHFSFASCSLALLRRWTA
jgi:hypothetical protein